MSKELNLKEIDFNYIKKLDKLELIARYVVEGFITGLHRSPFHGFSVEFAEHRLYNIGESTRHIDWKLFARTDKLFVKRYEEETNLRCHILLDNSSSMYFPDVNYNKLQFSIYSIAAIINILKRQRDAIGMSVFSNSIEHNFLPKSSNTHIQLLYNTLSNMLNNSQKNKKTSIAETLHLIAETIHKRSLVIIFSDMFDNFAEQENLFAALKHLKYNKHEIIFFHTLDKSKEINFDFKNIPYRFIDMESGEKINLYPNQVRNKYKKYFIDYKKELKLRCNQYRIDYVEADINHGFNDILIKYMIKRQKMM